MKVKEESEKAGLKLNIQKTMIMASSLITSWEIDADTVADLILGASKITADNACSHEIKRCSLLGKKAKANLDSVSKSRDVTLPTNVHLVKAMVFCSSHVWMWELDYKEIWVLKNRCFWTVVLEKTLENPLDSKKVQESILKEISPEFSLEGLMMKLKLQCFVHLIGRTDSSERLWCWERLKVGGEGDNRGWDGWMALPAQ